MPIDEEAASEQQNVVVKHQKLLIDYLKGTRF